MAQQVKVSVIIKALNEEQHIARAIESALRAVAPLGGEVIVADSYSSDRTTEIASAYPVRVVRLQRPHERCCGVGAQLGFQYALGEFVYLLDGDMIMHGGFLEQALALFEAHPDLAGVGGVLVEQNLESLEYRARLGRAPANHKPGLVDRLDGGGLYRRAALAQLGYLTDRNLHSYEEFDLGVRLRTAGWTLRRTTIPVVDHYGHTADAVTLLMRRWRSGYICGSGEVLRGALGRPHLWPLLRELRELHLYGAVLGWWAALLLCWLLPLPWGQRAACCAGLLLFPPVVMVLKKRSLQGGLYAVLSWCVNAAGLVRGLLHRRQDAAAPIAATVLSDR